MSETPHERRERIKGEVAEDLRKTIPHLLTDIHEESVSGDEKTGVPLQRELARFASLLGVLANQAAAQSEQAAKQSETNLAMQSKVLRLTNRLFWVTIVLAVIALGQIIIACLQNNPTKITGSEGDQKDTHQAQQTQPTLQPPVQRPTHP
jgi:hypothetical protein